MTVVPVTPDLLGGVELERTERGLRPHRLPAWVRKQFPDPQLLAMEAQPSGVALAFDTSATRVALTVHTTRVAFRGAPRPRGRLDVVVDGELQDSDELTGGDTAEVDFETMASELVPGPPHTVELRFDPPRSRRIEIWLPHNESVEIVALTTDAPVQPVADDTPVWVHHGSSISHGSSAIGPTRIWPVVAARLANVRLRNLGLGGSAMVDPFVARTIRDTRADLISVKLGINVVNGDVMRRRAFAPAVHGFLDTIRDGHPDTPLVLVTPIFCGIHEHAPGPGVVDTSTLGTAQVKFGAADHPTDVAAGQLDLTVVRAELHDVVAHRDDPNLRLLDGLELYGPADAERLPLPDELHPDTETHDLIGRRFAERVFSARP